MCEFHKHKQMNTEETKSAAKVLLKEYYTMDGAALPQKREKSKWLKENNFGFFLGIIQYGEPFLVTLLHKVHKVLEANELTVKEKCIIESMYDFHIRAFKQHNGGSSCHTPTGSPSPSQKSSFENLESLSEALGGKKLEHIHLKKAVEERDKVCLFC